MKYPQAIIAVSLFVYAACASPAAAHPEIGAQADGVAEVELRIFLDMNPQDVKARTRLGFVLYRKNRLREAEREFSQVLGKAPNDPDAVYGMGIVKLKERKPADAVPWLQKALLLDAGQASTCLHLGMALEQTGRVKEAEAMWRKGLEICDRALRRSVDAGHEQETKKNLLAALQALQQKNGVKGYK